MMKFVLLAVLFASACVLVESGHLIQKAAIDQKAVCFIKKSCVDCLQLSHCSWCKTSNRCFSNVSSPEFCKDNDTQPFEDLGFSLRDNAMCICNTTAVEQNCQPLESGPTVEKPCSGRGKCICGRCVCETHAKIGNSTKIVMGEYCEFDNFSCDGPHCNEGPYPLKPLEVTDDRTNV